MVRLIRGPRSSSGSLTVSLFRSRITVCRGKRLRLWHLWWYVDELTVFFWQFGQPFIHFIPSTSPFSSPAPLGTPTWKVHFCWTTFGYALLHMSTRMGGNTAANLTHQSRVQAMAVAVVEAATAAVPTLRESLVSRHRIRYVLRMVAGQLFLACCEFATVRAVWTASSVWMTRCPPT